MGGYRTATGRQLKWRVLYRAGAIYGLPEASRAALRSLGIRAICDLRTPGERAHRPMDWHQGLAVEYYGGVPLESGARLEHVLTEGTALRAHMRTRMQNIYRALPFEQAPSYRHLFAQLAAGQVPLLFNCSAGKDRTGVAAALLLTALGVPRETILADYLLSNESTAGLQAMLADRNPHYATLLAADPGALDPVLTADETYLELAFDEIMRSFGSFDAYLARHLEVGPAELDKIRAHLLD